MTRHEVINEYFRWLSGMVGEEGQPGRVSYVKLLTRLHATEFRSILPMDQNREAAGISLRYRFAYDRADSDTIRSYLTGPCSVLEMLIALSLDCENIMDDPNIGDRTSQWFWGMITNLGLGAMYDSRFNKREVDDILERFINREYEPNGKGGLFTIRRCEEDLRGVEIWYQLMWYLDTIP